MTKGEARKPRHPDAQSLAQFIEGRNRLIDALEAGALGKSAYLEAQDEALMALGVVPRSGGPLSSLEEGLFNYQYYNTLAKRERIRCKDEEFRNPEQARRHRQEADRCYARKDRETVRLLEWLAYRDVEAYYIDTPARYLRGRLIEIVALKEHRAVFHTADEAILNRLVRAGVFLEGARPSVIRSYIEADY